ncbi:MAG: hypothetical protein CDV28_1189 [Candidatus Electronema aureum]|uniref:Uncharacterized protein n=1 Tax=Candidatus Electronema aureum TaxID=2005002 RepID=A0A521G151_9BACT|nr:MAG: hypothetical protein CDV28_1189 [Candidatus Electronema aureum]
MNKFAHHSAENDHRWFSVRGEAGLERLTPACPADRDHRGHVEGFSEKSMTNFRDSRFSTDAAAGLVLARIKTCVRRRLAGIAEAFSTEKREQNRDGFHAEAGDAVQQLPLLFQICIVVGFPLDFRVDVFDLPLKIRDMAFGVMPL